MKTLIIDYGMSNMASISQAVKECGGNVCISDNPKDLLTADNIILPGVGAFPEGMRNLNKYGWVEPLRETVVEEHVPLLGICLGMQLLATVGFEIEKTLGLNFISGTISPLPKSEEYRIPHVGWNDINIKQNISLLRGLKTGMDFYFVHSYHFCAEKKESVAAEVLYGNNYAAVVAKNNIFGTQFHPEKSGKYGFELLKNFLAL